ncbi:MAG: hypothetical protein SFY69_09510 [Planctomycetota bacterium]|nr:hypothetical protein [Planctomycetota bacterium]
MGLATPHDSTPPGWGAFVAGVAGRLAGAMPGAGARVEGDRVVLDAIGASARAWYRLDPVKTLPAVSLVTPDRYLSQSIEQDLVHTGDALSELLEEELVDLGFAEATGLSPSLPVEHFRDEAKLFTFRTILPRETAVLDERTARACVLALRAYDATFRRLGDMEGGGE